MKRIKNFSKETWALIVVTLACIYLAHGMKQVGEYLILGAIWVLIIFLITTFKNFGKDDDKN